MQIHIEQTTSNTELAQLNETVQSWHHKIYPNEFKPYTKESIEKAFKNILEKNNAITLIARNENKAIGYLIAFLKNQAESAFQYVKKILYIDQISVLPEYQNSGIGQLLMEKAYDIALINKVQEIQLDYWLGNNQAEHFFLKNGFKRFNQRMKKRVEDY
jgi:ribosomal protein S18 acetylase RimI-like enzyme